VSYNVERVDNEPIIVIRMLAPINPAEDLSNLYQETDALVADIPGTIYRIVDWTQAELTFDLVTELLDIQRKTRAATAPRSSRVKNHYVVNDHWGRFNVESLRQAQYGGIQAPSFDTLDEALSSIYSAMKAVTAEMPVLD